MRTSSHTLARLLGDWSSGPRAAHRRLTKLIRLLILDGRLPLDTAMPGERDLAGALGISRTTVATAYAALREQGYLSSEDRARSRTRVPSPSASRVTPETAEAGRELIDFAHAAPPAPGEALHRAYTRALDQLPRHLPRHGYTLTGLPELRAAVARRYTERGLPSSAEQILVTNGAQHGLALIARTLLRPRDTVVLDHPTYPHALHAFRSTKCRILPVPLAEHGWDLDQLGAATRSAAMAYLIPDFHNPTGLCLPGPERARLRPGCPVIVDETMAELAIDSEAPPPLAAYHREVISLGSADKTFWGGLRIGWVRADPGLIARLGQARTATDLGTPLVEQLACAELLEDIHTILPGRIADLRGHRDHLLALLAERLPDWRVREPSGGLSVWARLPEPVSSALAAVAPEFGVHLAAGPRFGVGGAFERHLRLPYTLDPATMRAGVDGIVAALAAVRTGRRVKADEPAPF
ncbi:PLP-dependent aminotransferase family protein [Sciscionella marina]|uniref:MocR-like transcription factor YczR n=1 Tax=Sciscionella marina TaxID=508770 RepID=UPI00039B7C96|nr:PLP-dependent aminotransferase family protein [Sciscionella marina]